ncbi:MATE family efflux transporter [Fusobacterium sp. SB021]|uniref:MATE family efflux transporter n=1 Tax=Fusobacterium sp. SB021 TaxID=2744227 RepID=UPI003CE8CC6F
MENRNQKIFSEMPVKKAVFKMAVPSVVSSLVLVIYNMADTFFVGQTHNAFQVAAVSLTNPVFVMFMAFANLLGIGGSTAVSIFLGERKKIQAKRTASFCCYASIILGIVSGILIIIFMNPLLRVLGSSENTYQFSKDYLFYIALGAPFIFFANTFGHTVRGEGAASASMIGGMIGTVVNIIFDPVFILIFNMGTAGAAIATVLGNIFGCVYYIYYFKRKSHFLSINFKNFYFLGKAARKTVALGIPAGVNSALMSGSNIVLNNKLVSYGDAPVAAMGVAIKVYLLIVFIHMGIANGIQPLLGYCFGAKKKERFIKIFNFSGFLTILIGTVLTAVYIIFSSEIIEFFINDREVIEYGKKMLIATSVSGPILGILFLCINSMQAVERPFPATLVSICRQGFIFIPLLYVLDKIFGLNGINFTQAAADYISIILSMILLKLSLKNIKEK